MMGTLPSDASPASQRRYALARGLIADCPPEIGEAIAITGSVSRGVADRFSDLEIYFWAESLRSVDAYQAWLRDAGAEVLDAPSALHPGSLSTKSWYRGIFIEASWKRWDATEEQLRSVLAAETIDHWELTNAWHVADALPLRSSERLTSWQARLMEYPQALQQRLVMAATKNWAEAHWWPLSIVNLWPLASRNARLELGERLCRRLEEVLRLLFAFNRRWEPDWKWLEPESKRLSMRPEHLVERVNAIVTFADADESVTSCLKLMLETMALAPALYDLSPAQRQIREALHPEQLLTPEQRATWP